MPSRVPAPPGKARLRHRGNENPPPPRKRGEAARRSLAGEGTAPRPETEML